MGPVGRDVHGVGTTNRPAAHPGHLNVADGVLARIDPAKNRIAGTVTVGKEPAWLSVGGGSIWVSMMGEANVVRVNPSTRTVIERVSVGSKTLGIAADEHTVWAGSWPFAADGAPLTDPGQIFRIDY
jgi:DNA-binding beta-propeller fold protein YncE